MRRYRKKPIEVEAVRYCWNPGAVQGIQDWGATVSPTEHWFGNCQEEGCEENADIYVVTLEGDMLCRSLNSDGSGGDWIVRGVEGEFYPVRHSIFDATYEQVE